MSSQSSLPTPPQLGALIRGHFFTGLLVLVPFAVIGWIGVSIVGMFWGMHRILPEPLRPENVISDPTLQWIVQALVTIGLTGLAAIGISLLGWVSKHYLGKRILAAIAEVIQHIPLIRSIYSALDQLLRTMVTGSGKQFSRVVYVEYPRKGLWAIAFVTGVAKGKGIPPGHLNIFIPTTPNPTSGFHMIVPEVDVRESDLRVEEAFRTIISLGIVQKDG